jgi:hypothetical protein
MLKRRLRDAGLSIIYSNHSFRAAGITNYLENDGTLEVAQRIAGHASRCSIIERSWAPCRTRSPSSFWVTLVRAPEITEALFTLMGQGMLAHS